jgi:hypothetical protein
MVKQDLVLVKLDTARTALAEAKTIQETKKILDVAKSAEIYARRQKLGKEAEDYAACIVLEALRQLGNMLKETPRNIGAKGILPITGSKRVPVMDLQNGGSVMFPTATLVGVMGFITTGGCILPTQIWSMRPQFCVYNEN